MVITATLELGLGMRHLSKWSAPFVPCDGMGGMGESIRTKCHMYGIASVCTALHVCCVQYVAIATSGMVKSFLVIETISS
jgi:hypothetical protein